MNQPVRIIVTGRVQGVSFRYYTQRKADELGITGWVRNLPDGSVEALICGNVEQIANMVAWLHHGPEGATVRSFSATPQPISQLPRTFTIER